MNRALMEAELRRDEGVRYTKYLDSVGIPTTGIGHNLKASPLPKGWTYPLTDAQVSKLFQGDLDNAIKELNSHISWWKRLDEVRQRVLVNMCFNLGINGLLGFKNTLKLIQNGQYAAAASNMKLSTWYKQVGARAVRLCKAMSTGVMPK